MDFADLFTRSAREMAPLAQRRGLQVLFDYRGPLLRVESDEAALHQSVHRLCEAAIALVHDGFLFLSAQTTLHEAGLGDVAVSVAAAGARADDSRIGELLRSLGMTERRLAAQPGQGEEPGVATGVCPSTGAVVSFAADRTNGVLFALDLTLPASPMQEQDPPPDAAGARAWLVSDAPGHWESLVRRLQRLGWATSTFASGQQASRQLAALKPGMARPTLVIAAPSGNAFEGLDELRMRLPPGTQFVLATEPEPSVAPPAGVETIPWPFSPGELLALTRRAEDAHAAFSGLTMPAPLTFGDRPHALVVDDNSVNLLVASGLLQAAGFEVATACSGSEAIERCREQAPRLVLMDIHMPDMDGLEATRRLRALQREGALPHFAIVAATADTVGVGEASCRQAGMDGFLSKPLTLEAIQCELARVLRGNRKSLAA
ncbi:response regulator [Piscinibacter sp.]|uniref:response regulator n=1 Tax=Piscinibacter sp. TaxID=1903157 RepID=UPI002C86F0C6|nr:response regulator [Albitalea sp.]HUG21255.1 response regulator [Albitalea sp.]